MQKHRFVLSAGITVAMFMQKEQKTYTMDKVLYTGWAVPVSNSKNSSEKFLKKTKQRARESTLLPSARMTEQT